MALRFLWRNFNSRFELFSFSFTLQKIIDKTVIYPPELVVLVTPNVSWETRNALCPAFCTRILEVPVLELPSDGINKKVPAEFGKPFDDHCPGLTKLHAFRLEVYDTIVFIEPDCLVLDDIYPLIKRGKVYTETEALVAAAPDLFPPDKFNSGVMVIRPSQVAFDSMMKQKSLLANYDGSDTGFLNSYYSEWHTEMAPLARLPFTYNAQRALYDMTYNKGHRSYWDVAIAPDLKIVHYSGSTKPWVDDTRADNTGTPPVAQSILKAKTGDTLTDLWRQWHQRSKNFATRYHKEKESEEKWKATVEAQRKQQEMQAAVAQKKNPKYMHNVVTKRYKELRQAGHDVKTSMEMARAEHGLDNEDDNPAAKVASMFGVAM